MDNLAIFCADIGSVKNNKFGWAQKISNQKDQCGTDIVDFTDIISEAIHNGHKVTIGFEAPLFVPARHDAISITNARKGEGNRPWSAGAGCGALATGIVEVLWILAQVKEKLGYSPTPSFDWKQFLSTDCIYLWEAFVTAGAKGETHHDDAAIAVDHFHNALPNPEQENAIEETSVLSLVGTCAIRAGWSTDLDLLSAPCLVIKA